MTAEHHRPLRVARVAYLLDVHPSTVRRYIADGILPAHRLGPRLVRVPYEAVARFMSTREGGASESR